MTKLKAEAPPSPNLLIAIGPLLVDSVLCRLSIDYHQMLAFSTIPTQHSLLLGCDIDVLFRTEHLSLILSLLST